MKIDQFSLLSNNDSTSLMLPLEYNQPENAKLLIGKGTDVDIIDNKLFSFVISPSMKDLLKEILPHREWKNF